MKRVGLSYDWERELSTTDPDYYRWTQWIFLKLFERGLAYVAEVPVNWCPALGTVLANEEIVDGKSEVGGFEVIRKPMRQWVLKITAYADRLLEDLEARRMAGQYSGDAKKLDRPVDRRGSRISHGRTRTGAMRVFTTRPDTLFGATYMVLAPEHPLVDFGHDAGATGSGRGLPRGDRPRRAISNGRNWTRKRQGSSPAAMRSIR